ncbi:RNase H domain-containing protein [Trichonephila clavipes]|nr:RNase H domain-containing protein [Trichonephila clavipes]
MKLHISELDLPNVRIQQRNLFLFQPWNTPRFHYINPFATYSKSTVAPVVIQRVFAYHRSQYSRYSAIYTDGSKRADYVGCGVVIEDIMHGYRLDTSCSIFTAEAVAIYRALQLIDSTMPRKYCIYTDSMSVLEALENYHDRCHPVVCTILDITSRLYSKGFDIVFCWLPSHVGIIGNEQADSAAKSATTHLPLAVPLSDMKRVIMHHIFKIWQESWSQQLDNKLHSVKPVIGAWPVMPMRRTDVKLTRLRIGHTRFTHRHLLGVFSEPDLLSTPDAEILEGFSDQGVIQVRRITRKRDSKIIPTKHIILTFNKPKLPTTVKAGYLNCKICPYIPNLLRCFKCQRLIVPQLTQTYAQAARPSTISTATQTDPNLSNIICPPLQCLTPISSKNPLPGTSSSVSTFSTSSSSTQDNLLPSPSSILPTIQSESLLQIPIPTTTTTTSPGNNLNTLVSPLETETRSPEAQQIVKRKSRNRRKRPKVQKPDIEIKRVPHRSRNATPTETTDDEDMITYDVEEEELEQDPFILPEGYLRALTPSRYRNYRE